MNKSKAVIEWRKRTKQKIVNSMGGKCQICGYDKCLNALELHHIDSSKKEFGFGAIRANPKSFEKIANELKKCILLCSNCHREIHSDLISIPDNYTTFNEFIFNEIKEEKKLSNKYKKINKKIFLTNDELIDKLKECNGNKSALARNLMVSESAIRKRLKIIPK
jgi:hypothetical protein